MTQSWNDTALPWQNTALPWKDTNLPWNNTALPWKTGITPSEQIDTPLDRLGAIHTMLPWRGLYPIADGTIDAADRKVTASLYSGG